MPGTATAAAAALPPIEETEEVWNEDDSSETLNPDPKAPVETPKKPEAEPETNPVADTTEEASADAKKPDEEAKPADPAEPTEEQKKAKAFDDLAASFTRDTVGYMRSMHALLTPEQKAALGLTDKPAEPAPETTGAGWADDSLTAPEKFVKANVAYIQDLPRFAQGVTRAVGTHEQVLIQHDNTIAALTAQVEALSTALGMALPKANLQGIDPKAREAYAAQVKATAAQRAAAERSKETPTPKTPKNGSGGGGADPSADLTPRANESFTQLFRRVAAASRS